MLRLATCLVVAGLSISLLGGADEPAKPKAPLITVSKETTYLLGPLDSEGYVDYVEAVNQRAARGVTVETNYEVVVRSVLGSESIPEVIRQEYFKRLGVKAPPEGQRGFQGFLRFHSAADGDRPAELENEYDVLMEQPWSEETHPRGAAWLKEMGPFLDRIVEGTRLPHMYAPYDAGSDPADARLIASLHPSLMDQRELARSLRIRAFSRIDQGNLDGAWSDVQAIHRLARLVARGFLPIESMVAVTLEWVACATDESILHSRKLTPKQARRYLSDLVNLAPLSPVSQRIDQGQRLETLDAAQRLARGSSKTLNSLFDGEGTLWPTFTRALDWNVTLEVINQEYDQIAEVLAEPDLQTRKIKQADYEKRLKNMPSRKMDAGSLLQGALLGTPKTRGRTMAELLLAVLAPTINRVRTYETRTQAELDVMRVAFAVEIFRLENGKYPETLEQLAPAILESIPPDPSTGKPLVYHRDETLGFLVYSLGTNEKDDDGRLLQEKDDIGATGKPRKEE